MRAFQDHWWINVFILVCKQNLSKGQWDTVQTDCNCRFVGAIRKYWMSPVQTLRATRLYWLHCGNRPQWMRFRKGLKKRGQHFLITKHITKF